MSSGSTGKVTFIMPYAFTLTKVKASLRNTSSNSTVFDITVNGSSVLDTNKLTISANNSLAEATPTTTSIAKHATVSLDIVTAGVGATGGKIYLIGYATGVA